MKINVSSKDKCELLPEESISVIQITKDIFIVQNNQRYKQPIKGIQVTSDSTYKISPSGNNY